MTVATKGDKKLLLTIDEVSDMVGLCTKSIRNNCVPTGTLRFTRIGKSLRFRPSDIEEWIESRTQGLTDDTE